MTSCATVQRDCYFHVSGKVSTDDKPLAGVLVKLIIDKPVFKAITPVQNASRITDDNGQFDFSYLDDCSPVRYLITFSREGFKEMVLKGTNENLTPYSVELERE